MARLVGTGKPAMILDRRINLCINGIPNVKIIKFMRTALLYKVKIRTFVKEFNYCA